MKRILLCVLCGVGVAAMAVGSQAQNAAIGDPAKAPVHTYRLTYTLTESDGDRKIGVQRFVLAVDKNDNRYSDIKIGSKIPVVTGGRAAGGEMKPDEYQVTYLDVGLNISAMITEKTSGLQLASTVEQSSVIDAPNIPPAHPVIRQTKLENLAMLKPGATLELGSMDVPGSSRHLDVTVHMEQVD